MTYFVHDLFILDHYHVYCNNKFLHHLTQWASQLNKFISSFYSYVKSSDVHVHFFVCLHTWNKILDCTAFSCQFFRFLDVLYMLNKPLKRCA